VLTITQINYIRELYFMEGKRYSEIKKMTGNNYRAIRKHLEMEDFNEKHHKTKRTNKSDILRPIINRWLTVNDIMKVNHFNMK
jgi:U3 small nucleolar RNA-associated protein 14